MIACADLGKARWLFDWVEEHAGSDKVGHFVLIGTLAWTLNYALRGRLVPLGFVRVQLGGMIIAIAITIEEVSQIWIPGRQFDLDDLAANYAGIHRLPQRRLQPLEIDLPTLREHLRESRP